MSTTGPVQAAASEGLANLAHSLRRSTALYVAMNITEPGVCPGAWSTANERPASSTGVPSSSSFTSSGSLHSSRPPNICWVVTPMPLPGSARSSRS